MPTAWPLTPNNARSTTTGYVAGSGLIALAPNSGPLFGNPTPTNPVVVSTFAADGTPVAIYRATGRAGDTLTGLTLLSASDFSLPAGSLVEKRWCDEDVTPLRQAINALESAIPSVGPYTFYASREGIPLDSNLTSGGGTDASAALQTLLDKANTLGRVRVIVDGPALVGTTLLVWSNTELVFPAGCGLFARAGIAGPVLQNKHPISSYNGGSPLYDWSMVVDHDITIRGGYFNGNRAGGASGGADPAFGAGVEYLPGVAMHGVKDLTIEDLTVYDPCTFSLFISNALRVGLRNLRFIDPTTGSHPAAGRYTDGLHLVGPVDDLKAFGLSGSSADDFIALNAGDGNLSNQALFGSFAKVYKGPITRVTIDGVHADDCLSILRFLSLGSVAVDRVSASNVKGTAYLHAITSNAGGTGVYGRADLADWQVSLTSDAGGIYADIQGNWDTLRFARHVQRVESGKRPGSINVNGSTLKQLLIEDHAIEQQVAGNEVPILDIPDGPALKFVRMSNCTYRRDSSLAPSSVASHIRLNGANGITELSMSGCSGINVPILVDVASTLVAANVTMAGTRHDRAGGTNGTVRVGNGQTVNRLIAGASNTAKLVELVGTGAVTVKKTDATEDS